MRADQKVGEDVLTRADLFAASVAADGLDGAALLTDEARWSAPGVRRPGPTGQREGVSTGRYEPKPHIVTEFCQLVLY